jgi:AAA+ superfamily predicted ATPase/uncharacterized protein (UPF0297 family)
MSVKPMNPKMIEKFQKAIRNRNVADVYNALENGVNPSTQIDGCHPLELLMYDEVSKNSDLSAEEFHRNGSELVELLLLRGVKLVEEERYATTNCEYLVDRFLASKNLEDTATIVLHALFQSLEEKGYSYEPQINCYVADYLLNLGLKEGDDLKFHVTNSLEHLQEVHDLVRRRLEFPQTAIERAIVADYFGQSGKLDYWIHKFERPKLKTVYAELGLGNPDGPWSAGSRKEDQNMQTKEKAEEGMAQHVQILEKKQPQQVLTEMDQLIGLTKAKSEAKALMLRAQFDAAREVIGLPSVKQGLHMVFDGNPGTGKTTWARKQAELLHSLGLVGNRYIEISREHMVGQFIGQTEKNMVDLFKQADVVFIDEAYNLVGDREDKKDYGNQVLNALMTALENKRDTLTVFFAGYPEEMRKFIASNPGLKSRVTHYQHLDDYSTEELGQIMDSMLKKGGLKMEPEARKYALAQLETAKAAMGSRDFGNARIVRTLVEQLPNKMAERLFSQAGEEMTSRLVVVPMGKEELSTVRKSDIEALNLTETLGVSAEKKVVMNRVGFKYAGMDA